MPGVEAGIFTVIDPFPQLTLMFSARDVAAVVGELLTVTLACHRAVARGHAGGPGCTDPLAGTQGLHGGGAVTAAGWPLPPAAMERDRGPPPASPSPR